jgi:hypothetical protein
LEKTHWKFGDVTVFLPNATFCSENLLSARIIQLPAFRFHLEQWLGNAGHRAAVLEIEAAVSLTSRSRPQLGRLNGREMDKTILFSMELAFKTRKFVVVRDFWARSPWSLPGTQNEKWQFDADRIVQCHFPLPAKDLLDYVPLRSVGSVQQAVHRWLKEPEGKRLVAEIYRKSHSASQSANKPAMETELLDEICEAWLAGKLFYLKKVVGGGSNDEADLAIKIQPLKGKAPASGKTWIEIVLVDESGRPMPGEEYKLQLTDGSVRGGKLGQGGSVRVQGIDPGTCRVSFPELDAKVWWPA